MKKANGSVDQPSKGYEISLRQDELAFDFYRFLYGEAESERDEAEACEDELSDSEHAAFLKSAFLLFVAAVGTVVTLLVL